MKQKTINQFKLNKLEAVKAAKIIGGQNFCEWYLDLCKDEEVKPSMQHLRHMMQLDAQYGGIIPNGFNLDPYEDWVDD